MMPNGLVEELILLDNTAKEDGRRYPMKRFLFAKLHQLLTETRQFVGIAGLRGTGKTILLRQLAATLDHSFYVSADTLPPEVNIFDLSRLLFESFGVRYLMLDEIHAISGWQGQLKKIYDFSDIHIVFTSSSSLELSESRHDLSRRLTLELLPLFSFREYLSFKKGVEIPTISMDDLLQNALPLYQKFYSFEPDFRTYSFFGALPACLQSPLPSVVTSVVEKVVQKDMLTAGKLSQEDIVNIRSVLLFMARAGIEGISYSALSRNLGITKYKAQQYVSLMQSASILKIILPYGANVLPEPKILFAPALRANLTQGSDQERLIGAIREEFFVHHLTGAGLTVNYLKSIRGEKLPDYMVFYQERKIIFEIGGAGKSSVQLKGVTEKERHILTQPGSSNGIPLILTGFLW